jgi:DivIVA domain-containing protein
MRRKNKQEQPAPASGTARITPVDIQQVEFRLAFRGYNERDVDAFLDRVTEDLSAYLEENQRLQTTPGVVRVPDREAADEAGAVVAQAREEAAAIIRRAEDEAAAIRASAGAGGGADARSAVAPFLNREREFLQGLGGLVQTHAEEIKAMVMALRARAETIQAGTTPGSEVRVDAGVGAEDPATSRSSVEGPSASVEPATSGEIRTRLGFEPETASVPDDPETVSVPDEPEGGDDAPAIEETMIVESATEPVYTKEGSPTTDRRERSLRELFWGED